MINLRRELKQAGATDSEVAELLPVAKSLRQLTRVPRNRPVAIIHVGVTALAGLALGMALVVFSQTSLPGSWLYPVQKLSDNVAIHMQPDYRGTVMMKRAQEVKELIVAHSSSKVVLATLSDYSDEAATYKTAPANYAAFEFCKESLQQAAKMATSSERQAINAALTSLSQV